MNTKEKRFYAATVAMAHLMIPENFAGVLEAAESKKMDVSKAMAEGAVHLADALLAELDATAVVKESLTPEPDADGWIAHKPGDPMPCNLDLKIDVKIARGIIRYNQAAGFWRGPSDLESNWSDCGEFSIVAWRPAENLS